MYQCSRAGASLNLKVRNRSKMRTNHPVVWYIAFIWYRLNVPKVNNACFTNTIFFFKKKYLLILRPLAEVRSLQLVLQFSKFSQRVRQEISCNDQSAPAKPRWYSCPSMNRLCKYFPFIYFIVQYRSTHRHLGSVEKNKPPPPPPTFIPH